MLVGRTHELELARAALRPGVTVSLVGPSGIGKTAIAGEIARLSERSVLVDCYGVSIEQLPERLAELQGRGGDTSDLATVLDDVQLLILDDWSAEIPLAAVREVFGGPILVTAHTVPEGTSPLPIHPFEVPEVGALEGTAAYELFAREAERVRIGAMDNCPPAAISAIVRRVNGNPLGISLAANHSAVIGATEVARLMEEGIELRDETRSPRQQSMEVALRFSWERLSADNQRIFYAASRFRRPVRITTLAELAGVDLSRALGIVRELTQRGALTAGAFPRPEASWRETALREFRSQNPDAAAELDELIYQRGLASAQEYRARRDVPEIGDGPSLWEAALDGYTARPPAAIGTLTYSLLRWSARFAAARFAPHFLGDEADHSDDWEALTMHSRALRYDPEHNSRALQRTLQAADTDLRKAETYFELALNGVTRGDFDKTLEMLARAQECGGSYQASMLTIAIRLARGEVAEAGELLVELHKREAPSREHVWALRTYDVWAAPPEERLRIAEATIGMVAEGAPSTRTLAQRVLADVLEHDHHQVEQPRVCRQAARELAESIENERLIASCIADQGWGALLAGDLEQARRVLDAIDFGKLYSETKLRVHLARAMLNCLDGDLTLARSNFEASGGPALHVPPLDAAREVVATAISLAAGDDDAKGVETMRKVWQAAGRSRREQIELHEEVEQLRRPPGWDARLAAVWLDHVGADVFRRLTELAACGAEVAFLDDFSAVHADGQWHYAAGTSAAMLRALSSGEPMSFEDIRAAVWPDETVDWESLINRVNVNASKLRRMGMKSVLRKTAEGFVLDCSIHIEGS